ncbi:hypothetical protein GCM10027610_039970 [Dactylosporangium cerinum]
MRRRVALSIAGSVVLASLLQLTLPALPLPLGAVVAGAVIATAAFTAAVRDARQARVAARRRIQAGWSIEAVGAAVRARGVGSGHCGSQKAAMLARPTGSVTMVWATSLSRLLLRRA